jgi:hypothetical protein
VPKKYDIVFKRNKDTAIVTGSFSLQVPATGRPDVIKTNAKFKVIKKDEKWLLDNYTWRDYLFYDE